MSLQKQMVQWLDHLVIQLAAMRMPPRRGLEPHLAEAEALIRSDRFFSANVAQAGISALPTCRPASGQIPFFFNSSIQTPFECNNRVHGILHLVKGAWQDHPTVILLHGWNDSLSYNVRLPQVAKWLAANGFNSARLALPYHFERRPGRPAPIRNFISEDLLRTAEATQQAVADIRALACWFRAQGCPQVGVLGVSLGGWLGGLALCKESKIDFGVLITPAARLRQLLQDLEFARPIRDALQGSQIDLSPLNLATHSPAHGRDRILLIKSEYDRFIAPDSIEELWQSWNKPEIWRLPHGHISVLCSTSIMRRCVDWVRTQRVSVSEPPRMH